MIRLLFVLIVLTFISIGLNAQYYESRDHYTGNWEDPKSWNPQWNSPEDSLLNTDIHIYGFITLHGSLYLAGSASDLWISDTLVVNGDLFLGNNGDLVIGDHGILIVRGDLKVVNNTDILNRGYIIVTGDFTNTSANYGGSFVSTDNPSKIFICDSVPAINNFFYPALNCGQQNSAYPHTGCNYGDITDLSNDPVYDFFRSTCGIKAQAGSNSPVCMGDTLTLNAQGGTQYHWSGPLSFSSDEQDPFIVSATLQASGEYVLTVFSDYCTDIDTADIIIKALPVISVTTNAPVCTGESILFSAEGGSKYQWKGPGGFISSEQNPVIGNAGLSNAGLYNVAAISVDGCRDSATLNVKVNSFPVADAGPDQVLKNVSETRFQAMSSVSDTGVWSVISGSGNIADTTSPVSVVSDLAPGQNVFRWRMKSGKCESSDDVVISVTDYFIPGVITPNGDGKNDFFRIEGLEGNAELTIMNRWGVVEYESSDYKNDWNGYGTGNRLLPDDTYFYILRLNNGLVCKGSLLIKRR